MDVTSSLVDLGNAANLSGAGSAFKPDLLSHILEYNDRLYFGGTHGGNKQNIIYHQLPNGPFDTEKTASGGSLIATVEKINNLQNADYDLLLSGEDGVPNH